MADLLERVRASLTGRYTIERELGRAGMATVYLAEDLKHQRKVAVKVLKPELAATLGEERFFREIHVAALRTSVGRVAWARVSGPAGDNVPLLWRRDGWIYPFNDRDGANRPFRAANPAAIWRMRADGSRQSW